MTINDHVPVKEFPFSKFLIIEDDTSVSRLLAQYFFSYRPEADIQIASTLEQSVFHLDQAAFDVITIDFHLPDGTGYDVARHIRNHPLNHATSLLFITADVDYKISFDFYDQFQCHKVLHKPITYDALARTLENLLQAKFAVKIDRTISFKTKNTHVRLLPEQILYIETYNKHTMLYTTLGNYTVGRMSIKELLEQIQRHGFTQIHRSFIVNKLHISTLFHSNHQWLLTLSHCPSPLPVGKSFVQNIKDLLS